MKVQDIRSFFKKPSGGSSSSREASSSRDVDVEEQVVEVPSRLKKGSSKKSKKDNDHLNVSIERSGDDDDSDREDPLPRSRRGKKTVDDDDSDREEPLPKSRRGKTDNGQKEKKRKARVLSDSDDDDFKPSQSQKKTNGDSFKPATKLAKVEVPLKPKEELKPVNPLDFFGSAPVRRETKKETKKEQKNIAKSETVSSPEKSIKSPTKTKEVHASPEKKKSKSANPEKEISSGKKQSPAKTEPASSKSSSPKPQNIDSPQKPRSSHIEPKKLRMETPTPEKTNKTDDSKAAKSKSPPKKEPEDIVKKSKTPEKKNLATFKVPTPVTTDKSKARTKRSVPTDDDDEEDDFNPKQKASSSKSTKAKPEKSDKGRDKTPSANSGTEDEKEEGFEQATTPNRKQNYMKFLAKMSMKPKNLGSKPIPIGAPNCLQGSTFVISGVLDSLERDDCAELIKKYGGRVTGSVSGKTSYLVVGDEPGESKVKKAVSLKVPQISEDDLLDMLRKSNPTGNSQDSGLEYSEEMAIDSEPFKTEDEDGYDADKSLFGSPATTTKKSPRKHARSPSKLAKEETPVKKIKTEKVDKSEVQTEPKVEQIQAKKPVEAVAKPVSNSSTAPAQPTTSLPADYGLMWVDKYKPKSLKNVVGQTSDTSNARKLVRWLQNWFKYHGSSQDKAKASWPGLKDPEGKTFKAALLSGPPGIGKTTSAHLAIKEVGYDYFELNASDTRNKRGLHENVADALSSKSLVFSKGGEELARKHVLIMDEVDGMSGNEDRGGVQELIALIKSSRVPVICICNDRNHPKIRSLATYCFDLRFNKPSFEQLRGFISQICFREKMKVPQDKVQQLITSTDNDVRQILHQLELFKEGKTDQAYNPKKDLKFGPWDVIRKVFLKSEHDKMSIHDKNGLFFQDYNIGPLFVQENYIKWTPAKAGGNRHKHMDLLNKTAASLADGDLVESVIRRSQNWGLLPVQAVFSSYIPGEYMESNQMGGVEFPQWLGKNSNKSKRQRLLQNLHTHLHLHISGSLEALNMDYLPYLRRAITKPLVAGDALEAAKFMEDYTLLRDDVESINDISLWPGCKDPMERVETKVKTAFTKQVNKEILPYSNAKPVKGKGRGGGQEEDLEALMEEAEGEAVEEEEDDSIEKDAMVKVRTKKAGSSKAAAGTSGKGKGKGKKAKGDYDEDDDEDEVLKPSKSKAQSKSRKGK